MVAQLITGDSASLRRAAAQLNQCDVAIIQHEYGVYGGTDGGEILHLLDQILVPSVVVLHTVLTDPTPHQRQVLEAVVAKADAVVTMTSGRARPARGRVRRRHGEGLHHRARRARPGGHDGRPGLPHAVSSPS